jgi:hypothetical protein
MSKYYKEEEIQEYIDDNIEYFKDVDRKCLHNEMFNTDYYIIGTYKAKEWVGDRAFEVIGIVRDYEEDRYDEVFTDLSNPEKVVNMYTFIVGEYLLNEMIP